MGRLIRELTQEDSTDSDVRPGVEIPERMETGEDSEEEEKMDSGLQERLRKLEHLVGEGWSSSTR